MPPNPLNHKMEFSPADVLALEVEQWPALEAHRNRIPNPWPDPIAYGWAIDWNTNGAVGTDKMPSVESSYRRPMRAGVITSITATAPRVADIVPELSPAELGLAVGDTVFVLNVPELQRPDESGSEWTLTDPLTSANGAHPQYLTVTAVTSTTITVAAETAPPPLTVGPLTVPANAFLRTQGGTFVLESGPDQAGKVIGDPWDVVMRTPDIPVTAGRWVRFGADVVGHVRALVESSPEVWDTPSGDTHLITMTYRFHDTAGDEVSAVSYTRPVGGSGYQSNTDRPLPLDASAATQVPAGAVSVRLEVKPSLSTSDYLDPVRIFMPFSAARFYEAAAEVDLPAYREYVYPPPPVDVFGDISGRVHTSRAALDACTMSFQLKGDTYDPLQSDILTPGKRVQLRLTDPTTNEVEPLFTGAIVDPLTAEYPLRNRQVVPITKVTCHDPLPRFATTPHPNGGYEFRSLRDILETVPSPSMVQDDAPATASSELPYWIDEASVLDHVVIVRDTWQAYAWIDRRGILRVMSRGAVESPSGWTYPPRTFAVDESNFLASMTPSYSSERLINTIKIKALRHIGDQTEEWNYGPYIDAASRTKHGPRQATFTVSTSPFEVYPDDAFDAYAADILARSSVPALLFSPVPFQIRKLTDLAHASADLMDVFNITSPAAGYVDVPHRVWQLEHEITLKSWTMTGTFEREYETQTPTLTPSASGNTQRLTRGTHTTYISSAASLGAGGWGTLGGFNTTLAAASDVDALADLGCSYSLGVITVNAAGYYTIGVRVRAGGNASTLFAARLLVNGTSAKEIVSFTSWSTNLTVEAELSRRFDAGDQITMQAYNNSGAPVALNTGATGTSFAVTRR